MGSNKLKVIADDTMEAIKALKYTNPRGRTISLDKLVTPAIRRSVLYKPDWIESLNGVDKITSRTVTVTRETTLEAASRFSDDNVCVLNFASAKHPGGGFLRGASAQEESIARSSALYHTLVVHPEYYEENKLSQSKNIGMYLDYAIYSPDVPVIRNDRGDWLEEPYLISVVTSPAPNRSAIFSDMDEAQIEVYKDQLEHQIEKVFAKRMSQVLAIMAINGHKNIVLGAWGCGVFGNNPTMVAKLFKDALEQYPYFENIVFAIYDRPDSEVYLSFDEVFGRT